MDKATQAADYIFEAAYLDKAAEASKLKNDTELFSKKHMEANKARAKAFNADPEAAKAMLTWIRGRRLQ
jgi:hypothetical protein